MTERALAHLESLFWRYLWDSSGPWRIQQAMVEAIKRSFVNKPLRQAAADSLMLRLIMLKVA